ncbi:MAG: CHAD domain-containing protein [Candidatus Binatus sp.]|uniref:CHAD domain-containing protein n=1 Tax=Candidatus Binatus sp. TaxID=2811406 RepID=UPI00271E6125|nr:CHAD domain-containing protein [Candidatus Binatus sp.]MDO8431700.1 CHAD domain-containing protein [Candidatus Binatus sp.]
MAEAGIDDSRPRKVTLAPAEKAGECARKAIAAGLVVLRSNQPAAIEGEAEAMHQLRVSSRRLRASLQVFEKVLYAAQVRIFTREIKWIAGLGGAVRDCDIKAMLVQERAQKIDPELAKSIEPIVSALANQRSIEHAALCAALTSKRYRALIEKLAAPSFKKAWAERKLGIIADEVLDPIVEDAQKRGRKLNVESPPRGFHKLRVRLKRLRYALEMLSALGAKNHKKTLARLEELQDLLGEYNDANVTGAWLMSFADNLEMPARTVLAAGALIHSLGSRAKNLRRQSIKEWRKFQTSGVLDDALDEIRRAGQLAPVEANLIAPEATGVEAIAAAESRGAEANAQSPDDNSIVEPAPEFSPEAAAETGTH